MEFVTAKELFMKEHESQLLSTGLPRLDALLDGGFAPGTFNEIVGLSGVGKTQFCMQLAVNVQRHERNNECVYVDTEGGFSTKRVCDMTNRCILHESESNDTYLRRIHHARCHDAVQLTSTLHRLPNFITNNQNVRFSFIAIDIQIGLVIVDSVAMPIRGESEQLRQTIVDYSRILAKIAIEYRCVVVVVNHVAIRFRSEHSGYESSYLASALGTSWCHYPTIRLWLCPAEDVPSSQRSVHVTKNPFGAIGSVSYRIVEGGLEEVQDD
ncbi:unnamed protein product [Anisakis simplex]|uniref:DNA repair protein RAD51 homolog 3 n=1 Tax=Anisakis simplex TaxID=6269 RepID=A0A0M3K0W3_ANISI|nr:unnamed protein product [Anisakis simplex]